MKKMKFVFFLVFIISSFSCSTENEKGHNRDKLIDDFKNPPQAAKPRVWWHWMNGNITKAGIKKDLLWLQRIGIGGFHHFDAYWKMPDLVDNHISYMTDEWKEAFSLTTKLADSLGLKMSIAASPGWSETGGPWVPARDGMKKYVWSEMHLTGGKEFVGKVPDPPTTTGSFQNLPLKGSDEIDEQFYKDVALIAYKEPSINISLRSLNPEITSSGGHFSIVQLTDGDFSKNSVLPPTKIGDYAWIQFEFEKPITIRSLSIAGTSKPWWSYDPTKETRHLEVSDDGQKFRRVMDLPYGEAVQQTFSFEPITAKFFRFLFLTEQPKANKLLKFLMIPTGPLEPTGTIISEINLKPIPGINRFEEKAAFSINQHIKDLYEDTYQSSGDVIQFEEIIDLSSKMNQDGTLEWTVPDGSWTVLRFGYSLTGSQNDPAAPEGTGLEVDKLDPDAVKRYIQTYLDLYKEASGGKLGESGGPQYIITDSWEAGLQNWTHQMVQEFEKRRGYSMIPWMPVLTGRVVKSTAYSDKFLWDFRKTLGEMLKEYHYDILTDVLRSKAMGRYTESHESGRAFIGDGMAVKSKADIPMSSMWVPGGYVEEDAVRYEADIRESASVAHLYGQNLVAAESMSAISNTWAFSPERLKPTADWELASGLNRFVIHTSVHQPIDRPPGLSLGPFGQWFNRHETWAEQAEPWITYLARSSYMLQQGRFVADILYFYGEDNNITHLFKKNLPDIPEGYNYDFINAEALINLLEVKDGKIITPSGMTYEVLALDDNSRFMSLDVLKKIRNLVREGAVVIGSKPIDTPGLGDDPDEFRKAANDIWDTDKPNVYSEGSIQQVLLSRGIQPDFRYTKPNEDTELRFVHRRLDDMEIYWVNNPSDRFQELEATFRVEGRSAEIWHPVSGRIEKASYKIKDGVTQVPLLLEPHDAYFIVFSDLTDDKEYQVPKTKEEGLATLSGEWQVSFEPDRGAPESIMLDSLISWTDHPDPGVKYFSGTAAYTKTLNIPAEWLSEGNEIWLDLGKVKNLAEVMVNRETVGIVWKTPFKIEITDALKPGENQLKIEVTNLWVNRLIGDEHLKKTQRITCETLPFYSKNSPLLSSGLQGPVKIIKKVGY